MLSRLSAKRKKTKKINAKSDSVIETIEEVAEVVEDVAEVVEDIIEIIGEKKQKKLMLNLIA